MTRPDDIDTATLRDLYEKAQVGLVPTSSKGAYERQFARRELENALVAALPALLDVVDNATTQKQRADHLSAKVSRVEALADLWFETGGPSPRWQNDLRRALGGDQHQEGQ